MSLIERSIRQPVAVTVVVLLLVIFGIIGLTRIPIQLTPTVDQPVVSVTTRWFGASPQEIEKEIIEEQEEVLREVKGLREMLSTSREAEGTVTLKFYVGIDKEAALNEVRDKLRQVPDYPPDVDEPVVESVDSGTRDYMAWIILRPKGGTGAPTPSTQPAAGNGEIFPFTGDLTELQTFMEDNVKPMLKRVEGVAEINVLGGREKEVQVRVDLEKLAARGITITQFDLALMRQNQDVSAGTIAQGKNDTSVRAMGQYTDPEQVSNTVVAYSETGAPIYVKDVADVVPSYKEQRSLVRSLGQPVLAINAKMETGGNVIRVMKGLTAAVAEANREILDPRGWNLEMHQVYDQTTYVHQSIETVTTDLLIGAVLAATVLFLTLRSIGATMVVAVSIPISIIGTFLGMYLTGRNLNVISMAGLSFAIGMGVDNTIVVLENIFRHREMGKDRIRAALDGTQEVWGAIVAATLANIAVFLPVVFIDEEAGQLFRDISLAISISLFLYMVVSPTVIPMLATIFLRKMPAGLREGPDDGRDGADQRSQTRLGRLTAPLGRANRKISAWFYNVVLWLTGGYVRRFALVVVMIFLALVGSWALMPPRTYLPEGNQNLVFGILSTPPGYSIQELNKMADHVERTLAPWWNAKPGSPELKQLQEQWLAQRDQFIVPAMEQQIEGMKAGMAAQGMPPDKIDQAVEPMVAQLNTLKSSKAPPGIENFFFVSGAFGTFMGMSSPDPTQVGPLKLLGNQAVQGIPGTFGFMGQMPIFHTDNTIGGGVDIIVTGPEIDTVRNSAAAIQGTLMGAIGRFIRPDPINFDIGRPELRVRPDLVRAAAAGVTPAEVREITQVAVDGRYIGDFRYQGRSVDLTVVANDPQAQGFVDVLRDVPLATRSGRIATLDSVANLNYTDAPQQINRYEEQPSVTLTIPLERGETVEEMTGRVNAIVGDLRAKGVVPPSVRLIATGSASKLSDFMKAFIPLFALAAIITYLLLAALFESFLHPFVIIMSVPFALVGGFFGLWLLHQFDPTSLLDVLTMLGFVILIGTIVNNPILIVHQALNYMNEGMDHQHAIAKSTQTRVRPIFMSVITSVAGMAPLVVFGGQGSELYRGLGAVVIGGLLVSTVFTLLLTPTLMSLMLDLQGLLKRMFTRGGGGGGSPPKPPHHPDRHPDRPAREREREQDVVIARTAHE